MEKISIVYVRFDKGLDYKAVVNSKYIKSILEHVYGYKPNMISPTVYKFDRDLLGVFVQKQYDLSKQYAYDMGEVLPKSIEEEYGSPLRLQEFEPELLTDDNLLVITTGDRVLGVFASDTDFEKMIAEL